MQSTRTILNSGWRFKEAGSRGTSPASDLDWMPAQVPGHVHLDLVRAGVIRDPFYRMAERGCAWVDETDWVYETTFDVQEPPAHAYLVFHGLDTIAEITLNGQELGRTDNMFVQHEFQVGSRLRAGENTLQVLFRSALRVGNERQKAWTEAGNPSLPEPAWNRWDARSFVRKAQYMFGWDWGPELISCGIWKSVELVTVPVARLLDWKYDVEFREDGAAVVRVEAEVERAPGQEQAELSFCICAEAPRRRGFDLADDVTPVEGVGPRRDAPPSPVSVDVPAGQGIVRAEADLVIDAPRRWYPNGCSPEGSDGGPWCYGLALSVRTGKRTISRRMAHLGLRTIELVREKDEGGNGASFKFRVNGVDVFAKGANWIPDHSFPSHDLTPVPAVDGETLFGTLWNSLRLARDAGFNMLRVWGGGLYESEMFYHLCDRAGIMVWQDFPYACGYYPDTGEYAEAARKEATAAVRRIRNHPSLALWCGNNENHQMWHDHWEGPENRPPRYLGEKLYHEVLPAVVEAEDPKTPYWPSSPYGGDNPNSQNIGDRHDWDVWHGIGDWVHYPEDDSRFLSEFGFASSCGLNAWDGCLAPTDKFPRSPAVRWHDKTRKGYETYLGYVRLHFPEAQTLEDLVYYSQLNQAEALKCGIVHWRRRKGRCWGTLFWQLNDCWPVQSWAVVDSALEPKAAWYAAKRFYAPVLLSLVRKGDGVEAHITNDLLRDLQGEVTVTVETFAGDVLASVTETVFVPENGTAVVAELDVAGMQAHARDVYVYARFEPYDPLPDSAGRVENYLLLAEPKELRLSDPGLRATMASRRSGYELTLTAERFAPYVWWRFDGHVSRPLRVGSDNFIHLRAGDTRTIPVATLPGVRSAEEARGLLRVRSL